MLPHSQNYESGRTVKDTFHGTDFQINVLVLYAFNNLVLGQSFELRTEDETYGKFDDVHLITQNTIEVVQVKHAKDDDAQWSLNCFATKDGKGKKVQFYKYFDSWYPHRHKQNVTFKIYTNHAIADQHGIEHCLNGTRFKESFINNPDPPVAKKETIRQKAFRTEGERIKFCSDHVFRSIKLCSTKFSKTNLSENKKNRLIKNFLSTLQLISEQENVADLSMEIKDKFRNFFKSTNDAIYYEFFFKIKDWLRDDNVKSHDRNTIFQLFSGAISRSIFLERLCGLTYRHLSQIESAIENNFTLARPELTQLNRFLDKKSGVLVLSGISGIGKSALIKKYYLQNSENLLDGQFIFIDLKDLQVCLQSQQEYLDPEKINLCKSLCIDNFMSIQTVAEEIREQLLRFILVAAKKITVILLINDKDFNIVIALLKEKKQQYESLPLTPVSIDTVIETFPNLKSLVTAVSFSNIKALLQIPKHLTTLIKQSILLEKQNPKIQLQQLVCFLFDLAISNITYIGTEEEITKELKLRKAILKKIIDYKYDISKSIIFNSDERRAISFLITEGILTIKQETQIEFSHFMFEEFFTKSILDKKLQNIVKIETNKHYIETILEYTIGKVFLNPIDKTSQICSIPYFILEKLPLEILEFEFLTKIIGWLNNVKQERKLITKETTGLIQQQFIEIQSILDKRIVIDDSEQKPHITRRLKFLYKNQDAVSLLDGRQFPVEKNYIQLKLVNTTETKRGLQEEKELNRNIRQDSTIKLQNILNEEHFPKKNMERRLLITGQPGAGKSTFCQCLINEWIQGRIFQKYTAVFWIKLRNIHAGNYPERQDPYTIEEIVLHECFKSDYPWELASLKEYIHNQNNLWIVDGFDELPNHILANLKPVVEWMLSRPHCILTSRPTLNSISEQQQVKMELIGFSDAHVKSYISQFFDTDQNIAKEMIRWLEQQPQLQWLTHIPIQLQLICLIWKSNFFRSTNEIVTITLIYEKVIDWLAESYQQRVKVKQLDTNALSWDFNKLYCFLEQLAFDQTKLEKQIFVNKEVEIYLPSGKRSIKGFWLDKRNRYIESPLEALTQLGLLRSTSNTGNENSNYYFSHLTFQEFLAAHYIAKYIEHPNIKQFILEYKYHSRYNLIWPFVAGLLRHYPIQLTQFLELLLDESTQDILGFSEIELLIKCLAECEDNLTLAFKEDIIQRIKPWLMFILNSHASKHYLPNVKHLADIFSQYPNLACQIAPWGIVDLTTQNTLDSKIIYSIYLLAWAQTQKPNQEFLPLCFKILALCREPYHFSRNDYLLEKAIATYAKNHMSDITVSQLISLLENKNLPEDIRDLAFEALANIINPDEKTIQVLFTALEEFSAMPVISPWDDFEIKPYKHFKGIKALCDVTKFSAEMMSALFSAIKSENCYLHESALYILSHHSNPFPQWVSIILAIPKKEYTRPAFAYWQDEYYENGEESYLAINKLVISTLTKFAQVSPEIVKELIIATKNKDSDIRKEILKILNKLPYPSVDFKPILINALKDLDVSVRDVAIEIFCERAIFPLELITALLAIPRIKSKAYSGFSDDDDSYEYLSVDKKVIEILHKISNPSDDIISLLISVAKDEDVNLREAVIQILATIPNPTNKVIEVFIVASKDNDKTIRRIVCDTLVKSPNLSARVIEALLVAALDQREEKLPYKAYKCGFSTYDACHYYSTMNVVIIKVLYKHLDLILPFLLEILENKKNPKDNRVYTAKTCDNDKLRLAVVMILGSATNPSPEIKATLVHCLLDDNHEVRQKAAKALLQNEEFCEQATAALIADADKTNYDAIGAIEILATIINSSVVIIETLNKALKAQYEPVRYIAARALANAGNLFPETIEIFINLFNTKINDKPIRALIIAAFSDIPNPTTTVKKILKSAFKDKELQRYTVNSVHNNPEFMCDLLEYITAPKSKYLVDKEAFQVLKSISNPTMEVLSNLFDASLRTYKKTWHFHNNKPTYDEITTALVVLYGVTNPPIEIVEFLLEKVNIRKKYIQNNLNKEDTFFKVKENKISYEVACIILEAMSQPSAAVIELLITATKECESDIFVIVLKILGTSVNFSHEILELLITALHNDDKNVCATALEISAKIPDLSPKMIEAITNAIRKQDNIISQSLIYYLRNISNPPAWIIQIFFATLKSCSFKETRWAASSALNQFTILPIEILPVLIEAMEDKNTTVRYHAIKSLGCIFPFPKNATQLLLSVLQSDESYFIEAAVQAVAKIFMHFNTFTREDISCIKLFLSCIVQGFTYIVETEELTLTLPQKYITFNCKYEDYERLYAFTHKFKRNLGIPIPILNDKKIRVIEPQALLFPKYLQAKFLDLQTAGMLSLTDLTAFIEHYPKTTRILYKQAQIDTKEYNTKLAEISVIVKLANNLFITGAANGAIHIWQTGNFEKPLQEFSGDTQGITALCAIAGYRTMKLVSASANGIIRMWDIETQQCIYQWNTNIKSFTSLLAYDEESIFSGESDGTINLWEKDTQAPTLIANEDSAIIGLIMTDKWIISVTSTGEIKVWQVTRRRVNTIHQWSTADSLSQCLILSDHEFVTLNFSGIIEIWDYKGNCLHSWKTHGHSDAIKLAVMDETKIVSLHYAENFIVVWDKNTMQPINRWAQIFQANSINTIASINENTLLISNEKGNLTCINIPELKDLDLRCRRFFQHIANDIEVLRYDSVLILMFPHEVASNIINYEENLAITIELLKQLFFPELVKLTTVSKNFLLQIVCKNAEQRDIIKNFFIALAKPLYAKVPLWSHFSPAEIRQPFNKGSSLKNTSAFFQPEKKRKIIDILEDTNRYARQDNNFASNELIVFMQKYKNPKYLTFNLSYSQTENNTLVIRFTAFGETLLKSELNGKVDSELKELANFIQKECHKGGLNCNFIANLEDKELKIITTDTAEMQQVTEIITKVGLNYWNQPLQTVTKFFSTALRENNNRNTAQAVTGVVKEIGCLMQ